MKPVLFVGGTGAVGSRATRALRRLHPTVPILVGGRDLAKAEVLAEELGSARPVRLVLDRPDLGLAPSDQDVSAVVTLLKDERLTTLDFAQSRRAAYLGFADFVFDIAPTVGRYLAKPDASPILLLGQVLGGTVGMTALHATRHFERVDAIAIGALLGANDAGGPAGQADFARLADSPRALLRIDGRFVWATDATELRSFTDTAGASHVGKATPLLDVASLAAATGARDLRVDLGIRPAPADGSLSNETVIEIRGSRKGGRDAVAGPSTMRVSLVDRDTFSGTSARGAAIAIARLLSLGGEAPVKPGLWHPEVLLDPAHVVATMRSFGATIDERWV